MRPAVFLSRFVGRRDELGRLDELARRGVRLVSLVGAAGTGKTRLAHRFLERLADGATTASAAPLVGRFCDLTEVRSSEALCLAVARTFGTEIPDPHSSSQLVTRVGEVLAGHPRHVLVLDNAEQIVDDLGTVLTDWLVRAPEATFLVTSRERLRLEAEHAILLEPLAVPDVAVTALDAIRTCESVELFVDRATVLCGRFELDENAAPVVSAIVRQLDGMPLAIELAAARLGVLTPEELLARLPRPLDVLSRGPRGADHRHATMRAALEWSWDLLPDAERSALMRCSVFRGGFSLAAAEAVLDDDAGGGGKVLDLVQTLRDKSLLVSAPSLLPGESRHRLYVSVREHAYEKLCASTDHDACIRRHADFYLSVGERCERAYYTAEGQRAKRELALEQDNLLAVVERGLTEPTVLSTEHALRVILALDPLLWTHGPLALRLALLDRAVRHAEGRLVPQTLMARVLEARARVLSNLSRHEDARADIDRALEIVRREGDRRLEGVVLGTLGWVLLTEGRVADARAPQERALALHREVGDRNQEGIALGSLGTLAVMENRIDDAFASLERAIAIHRAVGNAHREASTLSNFGHVLLERRRYDEARVALLRAVSLFSESENVRGQGIATGNLACVEHEVGDFEAAERHFVHSIALLERTGDRRMVAIKVGLAGCLSHERRHLDAAEARYRSAIASLAELGSPSYVRAFTARLATLLAAKGDVERARSLLESAPRLSGHAANPSLEAALVIHYAHIDVLDPTLDELTMVANARERIAEAQRARPGERSAADRSSDVRFALRLLEQLLGDLSPPTDALLVAPDGDAFRLPGAAWITVGRRPAVAALLSRLAAEREKRPGSPLGVDALFDAGWPGERAKADAARNRVHVALTTLRNLGLRQMLISRPGGGVLLDPSVPLCRASARASR